ncbi:hypothetical protein GRX03_03400 [Halovenus sp. WSH3]|uniref:SWIM-type domain-containing protein n=1 Tax=Halovenus carboxidivorans TaxID=2692199 RepID=A0A6B0SZ09_9EURY|nr:hypothetical protein [Halovenus carboxidivorans]
MSAFESAESESSVTNDSSTELEKRDVRALTECMTVLSLDGGIYSVTTESGSEYRVDAEKGRCTCPDSQHNLDDDEVCKHVRRVAFATGERAIPNWVNDDAVDPLLGEHVEGPRRIASDGGSSVVNPKGSDGEDGEDSNQRPDDCSCLESMGPDDPPCWPCAREGFQRPAEIDS